MSTSDYILTRTGYRKLQEELDKLVNEESVALTQRITELHEDSDFTEDPFFLEAMQEKNYLDERIARLRDVLAHAQIIEGDPSLDTAAPGHRITLRDLETSEEMSFDLLSSHEIAHSRRRGVSIASPVGKALLGQPPGQVITVAVPDGETRYEILRIEVIPDEN